VVKSEKFPFRRLYESLQPDALSSGVETTTAQVDASNARRRRKRITFKETSSESQVDLNRLEWPNEAIIVRRVEALVDMAINESRRRGSLLQPSTTDRASNPLLSDSSPRKRKQSVKLKIADNEPTEQGSQEGSKEPSKGKKRNRSNKQRSLLEFGMKKTS